MADLNHNNSSEESHAATETEAEEAIADGEPREEFVKSFDWNAHWYPVAVVANLDKRVPTAVTILARDLVVWWDRNGQKWQVWDDKCPHRLAPLSEGRIDEKGQLQCSYHGWCFEANTGHCTCIPQAPPDGNPVWKSNRASVAVYPSAAQEGILWFWPDTGPDFKDIAEQNPPPSIPALADPSFKDELACWDLDYGYEQLIENLMDPAHLNFAHHGILGNRKLARPINLKVDKIGKWGFTGKGFQGPATFIAPCVYYTEAHLPSKKPAEYTKMIVLVFICIPVSPGRSRLIFAFPKNFSVLILDIIPKWVIHMRSMLVIDSDLYLLHVAERKLDEVGNQSWEKACYVPTKSDAFVIAFRRWLRVYAGGHPDWGGRYKDLPPSPQREQIMDRYRAHVKICRHCTAAKTFFEKTQSFLQLVSIGSAAALGIASMKPIPQLRQWSIPLAGGAVLSTIASQWISHFVKKTYHYHDYNHALIK